MTDTLTVQDLSVIIKGMTTEQARQLFLDAGCTIEYNPDDPEKWTLILDEKLWKF